MPGDAGAIIDVFNMPARRRRCTSADARAIFFARPPRRRRAVRLPSRHRTASMPIDITRYASLRHCTLCAVPQY